MAEYMCGVEFQVQCVSFFTQHVRYDYINHAQEESAQESGLALQQDETTADPQPDGEALAVEDKWALNEPNREMIGSIGNFGPHHISLKRTALPFLLSMLKIRVPRNLSTRMELPNRRSTSGRVKMRARW